MVKRFDFKSFFLEHDFTCISLRGVDFKSLAEKTIWSLGGDSSDSRKKLKRFSNPNGA
jgi:hypothetical protein